MYTCFNKYPLVYVQINSYMTEKDYYVPNNYYYTILYVSQKVSIYF